MGRASEKPHWFCTEQIFKVQFFSNEVTIFALTFRFKAQQCTDQNLKVSHDLTKTEKMCPKLKCFYVHFQWQASPLRGFASEGGKPEQPN